MAIKKCKYCRWAETLRNDLCGNCDDLVDRAAFAIVQGIWTSPEVSPISNEKVWVEARSLIEAKFRTTAPSSKRKRSR